MRLNTGLTFKTLTADYFLRGKIIVLPDKKSVAFLSFVGNLDKRVELYIKCVEVGSKRYNEAISIMAAKAAYENKAFIETTVKDH
ncbi:hypothetical protein FXO38_21934 [Capsicum annuum]|uniref:Uncharacterized protein n=1 Tax=Capsicum annuum TaxID=4072 RepID=A0A2G2ZPF0_CAPAN|nr:hypothetical protein FXO37_27387 [Capsicum annuum]KAF3640815.1 hypothetical protein FXO38_21934 [Capsicum annuum]PHT83870.1 hypothetical protein T459_12313 [Capsicum annuum]